MLDKNIEKQKRKERRTWIGYKPLTTKTKKQKEESIRNKHKTID